MNPDPNRDAIPEVFDPETITEEEATSIAAFKAMRDARKRVSLGAASRAGEVPVDTTCRKCGGTMTLGHAIPTARTDHGDGVWQKAAPLVPVMKCEKCGHSFGAPPVDTTQTKGGDALCAIHTDPTSTTSGSNAAPNGLDVGATSVESDTPRTDAVEAEYRRGSNDWTTELNKSYGLARALERENIQLRAERDEARANFDVEKILKEVALSISDKLEVELKEAKRDRDGARKYLGQANDNEERLIKERDELKVKLDEARKHTAPKTLNELEAVNLRSIVTDQDEDIATLTTERDALAVQVAELQATIEQERKGRVAVWQRQVDEAITQRNEAQIKLAAQCEETARVKAEYSEYQQITSQELSTLRAENAKLLSASHHMDACRSLLNVPDDEVLYQAIKELREDKERLDWLEKRHATVGRAGYRGRDGWEVLEASPGGHYQEEAMRQCGYHSTSARLAIDAAKSQ